MTKKIVAIVLIVFLVVLLATLALPGTALAHGSDEGCHFGRGHPKPWFDGKLFGFLNSMLAKLGPGVRADFVLNSGQLARTVVCRS